jgi:hypothetical protein
MWKILGEVVVLSIVEQESADGATELSPFLDLLFAVALAKDSKPDNEEVRSSDTASIHTIVTQSKMQSKSNLSYREKEKDPTLPTMSLRSLLSLLCYWRYFLKISINPTSPRESRIWNFRCLAFGVRCPGFSSVRNSQQHVSILEIPMSPVHLLAVHPVHPLTQACRMSDIALADLFFLTRRYYT